MKWVNVLYYFCVSVLTIFLLLMGIALPPTLIFVIPICGYFYAFPKLKASKSLSDKALKKERNRFELEKQRYNRQIQSLLDNEQKLNQKLDIIYGNIDKYKSLLRRSISTMDGTVFEQYVGYRMLEDGYRNIQFTATTGDFGADIIAYDSENRKVCVQCKRYSTPVGVEAVQQITSARMYYECARAIVITNSTFTTAAKEVATKTGIELEEKFI